jgi:pyruvate formate lyase activating enzyme
MPLEHRHALSILHHDPLDTPEHPTEDLLIAQGRQGRVHSIEWGSMVDGPGLRCAIFLSGCLLRCQYCHNPDTWAPRNGRLVEVEEVIDRLRPYLRMMSLGHGGVTLSGGEPLYQDRFAFEIFKACRGLGLHTALDTSGYLGDRASEEDLDLVDLVLLDLKSGDPDLYQRLTLKPLEPTLRFARRLAARNHPVWIRFVLVPGLTDPVDNLEALANHVAAWPNVERLEVLPFHQMGQYKYEAMGIPYPLANHPEATADQVRQVVEWLRSRGVPAV